MSVKFRKAISVFLLQLFFINSASPLLAAKVPAGTMVQVRLNESLTSKKAKTGAFVMLTVMSDVKIDGVTVIKAGAQAEGNVSTAKKAAAFGQPGELGIQVTSVKGVDGTSIPVQAQSASDGTNQTAMAIILGLLCIVGFFIPGGEGELSSGVVINCRTLGDVDIKA
tara:strand:- start:27 stop:527 length:501 start_codon:yes stop_codon:yes gene_type:complete